MPSRDDLIRMKRKAQDHLEVNESINYARTLKDAANNVLDLNEYDEYCGQADHIEKLLSADQETLTAAIACLGAIDDPEHMSSELYFKIQSKFTGIRKALAICENFKKEVTSIQSNYNSMLEYAKKYKSAQQAYQEKQREKEETYGVNRKAKQPESSTRITTKPAFRLRAKPKTKIPPKGKTAKLQPSKQEVSANRAIIELRRQLVVQARDCLLLVENVINDAGNGPANRRDYSPVYYQILRHCEQNSQRADQIFRKVTLHCELYNTMKAMHCIALITSKDNDKDLTQPFAHKTCIGIRDSIMHPSNPSIIADNVPKLAKEVLTKVYPRLNAYIDQDTDTYYAGRIMLKYSKLQGSVPQGEHPPESELMACFDYHCKFLAEMAPVCRELSSDTRKGGLQQFERLGYLQSALCASVFRIGQALKDLEQVNQKRYKQIRRIFSKSRRTIFEEKRDIIGHKFNNREVIGRYFSSVDISATELLKICNDVEHKIGSLSTHAKVAVALSTKSSKHPNPWLDLKYWSLSRDPELAECDSLLYQLESAKDKKAQLTAVRSLLNIVKSSSIDQATQIQSDCTNFLRAAKSQTRKLHIPAYYSDESDFNQALTRFVMSELGQNQRDFNVWYHADLMQSLMDAPDITAKDAAYVKYFAISQGGNPVRHIPYENHIHILRRMCDKASKPGLMISAEPGAGQNHFVVSLLIGNDFYFINPIGTRHKDTYTCLKQLKVSGVVDNVYIYESKKPLQHDPSKSVVSCAPICLELVRFLSSAPQIKQALQSVVGNTKRSHKLSYRPFDISKIISSGRLVNLDKLSGDDYKQRVLEIRQADCQLLQGLSQPQVNLLEAIKDKKQDPAHASVTREEPEEDLDTLLTQQF